MSVLVSNTLSFFFSSDPKNGAQNISADGSTFYVYLNTPLTIPKSTVMCEIRVLQALIPYVDPNISVSLMNNTFQFTTSVAPAGPHTIVFNTGLYSIDGLSSALSTALVNLGLPPNLFTISGDAATQKTILAFLTSGDSVDFTIANSIRTVLGFNSQVIVAPIANYNRYSENSAQFNIDTSYLITSDIVSAGIPVNNQQLGIIANVPITSSPGSQIVFQPFNPIHLDARELIANPKSNLRFTLSNQILSPVNTLMNTWSFVMEIKYKILLTDQAVPLMPR